MVIAGDVGGEWGGGAWPYVFLVIGLGLAAVAAFGGLIAWLIARRWEAFPLGAVAQLVTAWWLRAGLELAGEDALLYGLAGGVAVGCAVGLAGRRRAPAAERRSSLGRPDIFRRVAAAVVIVGVLGALVVSTRSDQQRAKAVAATGTVATDLGRALVLSDAETAIDLALVVARSGPPPIPRVLQATGDRRRPGGAELVVRIDDIQYRREHVHQCWRYRIHDEPREPAGDGVPVPVGCPDVEPTEIAGNYGDDLAGALISLPRPIDGLDEIREVVEEHVGHYVTAEDVRIEVAWLEPGIAGIAVQAGLTDCLVTRFDATGFDQPQFTWTADPELLRSDQPGCRPELARHRPG